MKISKSVRLVIVIILFISITYTSADEKNAYVEELSYVGENWSVKYKIIRKPFKIIPLEINGKYLNESEKKIALNAVEKLYDFLLKRPNDLKKKIISSETLDSTKYEGILVIGGKFDWLYLFPRNNIDSENLKKHTKFLKYFGRDK